VKKRIAAFVFFAAAAAVIGFLPISAKADTTTYTFSQAADAGIITGSDYNCQKTNLWSCGPPSGFSFCGTIIDQAGWDTSTDAETASDNPNATECVMNPLASTFLTGSPDDGTPTSPSEKTDAYQATDASENGWKGQIQAPTASSPGSYGHDTVREHFLSGNIFGGGETEAGFFWQFGYNTTRDYVYAQDVGGAIQLHPAFQPNRGQYYNFRVRGYGSGGSIYEFETHDNVWHVIHINYSGGCALQECYAEVGTRIFCQSNTACPYQQSNNGLEYFKNWQYKLNGSWSNWNTGITTSENSTDSSLLIYCESNRYYNFYTGPGPDCGV